MLAAARAALIEHGVLAIHASLPPSVARITGDRVVVLLVYLKDGSFYLVKVGLRGQLEREYEGLSVAHAAMSENVPRPIGLTTQRSLRVLVTCGLRHEPFPSLRNAADVGILVRGMDRFFAASVSAFASASPAGSACALHDALIHVSAQVDWPNWQAYWEHISADVKELPSIRQHGDFAVNNIGVRGGTLVFFDWEDFGLVNLPGYDLAVLLLSLNAFNARQLRNRLHQESVESRLMDLGCGWLGMRSARFQEMLPAYLSLFIQAKRARGYGPEVAGTAVSALKEWLTVHGMR